MTEETRAGREEGKVVSAGIGTPFCTFTETEADPKEILPPGFVLLL